MINVIMIMIHGGMQFFNLFFDPFVFYISGFSEKTDVVKEGKNQLFSRRS
jgi:hypothetical protein